MLRLNKWRNARAPQPIVWLSEHKALRLSKWRVALATMCLLLGLLLSVTKFSPSVASALGKELQRDVSRDAFQQAVVRLEDEQTQLKRQVAVLQERLQLLQKESAVRRKSLADLSQELQQQRIRAGLVPLKGEGVKVVLDDATSVPAKAANLSPFLVHDYQLRDVLTLLWQGGAEAISVNGERIVATTSVYCVGSTLLINDTRLSPPYEILALGNSEKLEALLVTSEDLNPLREAVRSYHIQFTTQRQKELTVPAYGGAFTVNYAKVGEAR